jgi:hypothetical protein
MTMARPVSEESSRQRQRTVPARRSAMPGSRTSETRFPRPVHPRPPVVIAPRQAAGEPAGAVAPADLGRPDAAAPTRAGELTRSTRAAEARRRRRLTKEKLLVLLAMLAILAVTLLLLGLQWLANGTPSSSGQGGTTELTHTSSFEGGP